MGESNRIVIILKISKDFILISSLTFLTISFSVVPKRIGARQPSSNVAKENVNSRKKRKQVEGKMKESNLEEV